MDITAELGENLYETYSPLELINAWTVEDTAVKRNVAAIGDAIKDRQSTDPPVQVGHMIDLLQRNLHTMQSIEKVVTQVLEDVRVCCCGQDRSSMITLGTSVGETALSILTAGLVVERVGSTAKEDDEGWVPFGIMVATSVTTIVKNYFWEQQIEIQTDLSVMNSLISKDALLYVQGMLDGVRALNKINFETRTMNTKKMEERLRKIAAMPENANISPALMMQQVQNSAAYRNGDRTGTKTEAITKLILGDERDGSWQGTLGRRNKLRQRSGYHPVVNEEERRARLRRTYVAPTCCDYVIDVDALKKKELITRRGMEKQVGAAGRSTNSDFSVLTCFLERTRNEVRDDLLYVLDWFLEEEERWLGHPVSKMKRYALATSQYAIQLLAICSIGADAYKQQNEGEKSRGLELISLVSVIGSAVLGRLIEMGNRNVQSNTKRRADLRKIRADGLKTMEQVEVLVGFYKNLEGLRKQKEQMTFEQSQLAVLWASRVPGRYQAIADDSTRRVVTDRDGFRAQDYDATTQLGQRAAAIYGDLMDDSPTHSELFRAASRLSLASSQSAHVLIDRYEEARREKRQMRTELMRLLQPSRDSPKRASLRRCRSEERLDEVEYFPSSPARTPRRRGSIQQYTQVVESWRTSQLVDSVEVARLDDAIDYGSWAREEQPLPVLRRSSSGDVLNDAPGELVRSRSFAAMTVEVEESMFHQLEQEEAMTPSPSSDFEDGGLAFRSARMTAHQSRDRSLSISSYDEAVQSSGAQHLRNSPVAMMAQSVDMADEDAIVAAFHRGQKPMRVHQRRFSDTLDATVEEIHSSQRGRTRHRGVIGSTDTYSRQMSERRPSSPPSPPLSGRVSPYLMENVETFPEDSDELELTTDTKVRKPFWMRMMHFGPKSIHYQREVEPTHEDVSGIALDIEVEVMQNSMNRVEGLRPIRVESGPVVPLVVPAELGREVRGTVVAAGVEVECGFRQPLELLPPQVRGGAFKSVV